MQYYLPQMCQYLTTNLTGYPSLFKFNTKIQTIGTTLALSPKQQTKAVSLSLHICMYKGSRSILIILGSSIHLQVTMHTVDQPRIMIYGPIQLALQAPRF